MTDKEIEKAVQLINVTVSPFEIEDSCCILLGIVMLFLEKHYEGDKEKIKLSLKRCIEFIDQPEEDENDDQRP